MFTVKDSPDSEPYCAVIGGSADKEIIYTISHPSSARKSVLDKSHKRITVEDGEFQQIPSFNIRVLYIAGPSGAGKSRYCARYLRIFQSMYPECQFYLFSRVQDDPAFKDLDLLEIPVDDSLLQLPLEYDSLEDNCVVIFDDIDQVSNDELKKKINTFVRQVLEMGRHKNIKCLITSHLLNPADKAQGRVIMNESHSVTFFPQMSGHKAINYYLTQYAGLDTKERNKLYKIQSDWITLIKRAPQSIMTQHECIMVSELRK